MLLIGLSFPLKERHPRIYLIMGIISMLLAVIPLVLFYIAMSEVTKVGVGSFMDSGDIPITIPGQAEQIILSCNWGPGAGFYLILLGILLIIIWQGRKPLRELIQRLLTPSGNTP